MNLFIQTTHGEAYQIADVARICIMDQTSVAVRQDNSIPAMVLEDRGLLEQVQPEYYERVGHYSVISTDNCNFVVVGPYGFCALRSTLADAQARAAELEEAAQLREEAQNGW